MSEPLGFAENRHNRLRTVIKMSKVFEFGPFELDMSAAELRRDGVTVHVAPQPFLALELLIRRAGELVTRDEMAAHLWKGDTFVDFSAGLNFCIKQLRDVLGDNAAEPTYIATVPRRGYRFVAKVQTRAVPDEAPALLPSASVLSDVTRRPIVHRRHAVLAAALIAVALIWPMTGDARRHGRTDANPERRLRAAELVERGTLRLDEAGGISLDQLRERVDWLEQAVADAPSSSAALAALAEGNVELGLWRAAPPMFVYAKARALATSALAIDGRNALALGVLGRVALLQNWNWSEADRQLALATTLAPSVSRLHRWRSWYLSAAGRHRESVDEARRAVSLDPASLSSGAWLGRALLLAGEPENAYRVCTTGLDVAPASPELRDCMLSAAIEIGDVPVAVRRYAAALTAAGQTGPAQVMQRVFDAGGLAALCRWRVDQLQQSFSGQRLTDESMTIAQLLGRANDREGALRWLRHAADAHLDGFIWVRTVPALRALEGDPQFAILKRRVDPALFSS